MSFNVSKFTQLAPSQTIQFDIPTDSLQTMLLMQYKDSPNLYAYINCFLQEVNAVSKAIQDSINLRYLADATGAQLDVVGDLVGIGRVFYGAAPLGYFGFYDDPQSAIPSIGSVTDMTVGGVYKSITDIGAADFVMDDVTYKRAIYAKIIKNRTNCCVEDVLQYIDLITGQVCDTEIVETHCFSTIYIHEDLNQLQRIALSLMISGMRPICFGMSLRDNHGTIAIVEKAR